jgi:hypothetical protein
LTGGLPVVYHWGIAKRREHEMNTEAIISEARKRPALDGRPVSETAADFMRNAKARNARSQAAKDMSRSAAVRETIRKMLASRYHGAVEITDEMIDAVLAGLA